MFEVAHNTVADVGDVDWKKAAEVWPTWHATDFDVDQMVQQSAKQLGLVKFVAFLWQEGTTGSLCLLMTLLNARSCQRGQ